MCFTLQTADLPKVIEVCKFQSSITICEELTVAFVIHMRLYCFCGVEGLPFLIAPQANLPNTNLLSWKNMKKAFVARLNLTIYLHNSKKMHQVSILTK